MEKIKLANGYEIPLLGFGVFQITDLKLCEESVSSALKTGYRLFDTAACYGNERAVGNALKKSGLSREEVYISTKVWIQDAGYDETMRSFYKSLNNLQTDYLDLYFIHMPYSDYHGSWRAMEDLYVQGKIRALGVSNFRADRLVDLILSHHVRPAINQIELHPYCQQQDLLQVMEKYGIKAMAWAPFAEGRNGLFADKTLIEIGTKYGKSSAQIVLRWLTQCGIVAIPKSVNADRIKTNFDIWDFTLSPAETARITAMDLRKNLILDTESVSEICRLYSICFQQ